MPPFGYPLGIVRHCGYLSSVRLGRAASLCIGNIADNTFPPNCGKIQFGGDCVSGEKVSVSVVLTKEINEKLKELAQRSRRSKSAYIRQILRRYIQYVEARDAPSAEKVDRDIDKFWCIAPPGEPEGQQDK